MQLPIQARYCRRENRHPFGLRFRFPGESNAEYFGHLPTGDARVSLVSRLAHTLFRLCGMSKLDLDQLLNYLKSKVQGNEE